MSIAIQQCKESKIDQIDFNNLRFGESFSDHMFVVNYANGNWNNPTIKPYQPISLDPSAKVFHYGQAVFEGLKTYKDQSNNIWLFRPEENLNRINTSAERLAMPSIPKEIFFEGLETLLKIDKAWIPSEEGSSLYIRPFMIASEKGVSAIPSSQYQFYIICSPVQSYYNSAVRVLFADKFSRAAKGGVGYAKCAGNYAAQFYPTQLALKQGYQQIVWTDANNHETLEEAGTMNIFFRIKDTLITAPTSDTILSGITRKSIIEIAKTKNIPIEVRNITVTEVIQAAEKGILLEMFGSGTAAVVSLINGFGAKGKDYKLPEIKNSYASLLGKSLTNIQTNKTEDLYGWMYKIEGA